MMKQKGKVFLEERLRNLVKKTNVQGEGELENVVVDENGLQRIQMG
jgi:hypothetical protein